MIGSLQGFIFEKNAPFLLLEVQGVGYELQAPMTTFFKLPGEGSNVRLYTHFSVSENAQQLFGFIEKRDRELFRLLIKVSGVGPKMAVAILSMEVDDIIECISHNNILLLTKIPGVGKKTAERLIIEMRDKIKVLVSSECSKESLLTDPVEGRAKDWIAEAESALIALGYKPAEAAKSVSRVMSDDVLSSEELIRAALKAMIPA